MAARRPSNPGWYRDPDNPRLLRHWDGAAWGDRARTAPGWYQASELFFADERIDRSTEGPAHPNELREPVASVGGWSRDWLPWRPRQLEPGWPRAGSGPDRGHHRPARPLPSARLSPARRPLLAMVCLVVVAAAVVISSVAFITPYEIRRPTAAPASAVDVRFVRLADRQCASVLRGERAAFAALAAAPGSLEASATALDGLRMRLASADHLSAQRTRVDEWLDALRYVVDDQLQYASALRRATVTQPGDQAAPGWPQVLGAARLRSRTVQDAQKADYVSTGLALGDACRLALGGSGGT